MQHANPNESPLTERPIRIDRRFEGFPGLANGGYLAGVLLRELGLAGEITLRRPTPIETPLWVGHSGAAWASLRGEDGILAEARIIDDPIEAPAPVSFDDAVAARGAYRGFSDMPFPTCFVCGTERSPADALRIFPGALAPGRVAAPWVPGPAASADGSEVDAEQVVAALDCPGAWAVASVSEQHCVPMLLGRLRVRLEAPVRVGLPHVVVGLATGEERRKRFAATAIFDDRGRPCAVATSIWFPRP